MNAAIAQHLSIAEKAIIEIQEWASVLWVRVKGIGARFVSKKVVNTMSETLPALKGSEKQVAWAENIRQQLVETHSAYVEFAEGKIRKLASKGKLESSQKKQSELEKTNIKMKQCLTVESASWWIWIKDKVQDEHPRYGESCVAQCYVAGYTKGHF